MGAVLVDIAEAIKDEINGATWTGYFVSAERNYADWSEKLTDIECLHVDVVPWRTVVDLDDRGELTYQCEVDILLRKRFDFHQQNTEGRINNDQMDSLILLLQQIHEFFLPSQPTHDGRALTSVPNASWVSSRVMADYVRPHFRTNRQYTGWLRITYEITRVAGS